jgi:universal stress protein E
MKPPEKSKYKDIAAAVGFNPLKPDTSEAALNRKILELASSLALSDSASLHIIHAWHAYAESSMIVSGDIPENAVTGHVETQYALHRKELYRLWGQMRERIGDDAYYRLSPRIYMPKGPAKQMIANLADELQADLVVMGTIARTGISGLVMGNTAEAIVDQLSCSLLAVKPEGFTTPVKLTA